MIVLKFDLSKYLLFLANSPQFMLNERCSYKYINKNVIVIQSFGDDKQVSRCSRRLEVFLPDAEPEAFEMVLSYIYTDRIQPTKKGLCILVFSALMDIRE